MELKPEAAVIEPSFLPQSDSTLKKDPPPIVLKGHAYKMYRTSNSLSYPAPSKSTKPQYITLNQLLERSHELTN